jgi:hypothetical protein
MLSLRTSVVVLLSAVAAVAAPAAGADDGGVGVRLIASTQKPAGSLPSSYIVDRVRPGATLRRQVEVSNTTRTSVDVTVYAAAATTRKGTFRFGAGRAQNELSAWTTVDRGAVRLGGGKKKIETITIVVPRSASRGERYAVVWAEAVSASGAPGIRLVNRVGIRAYVSVGTGATPPPRFSVTHLRAKRSHRDVPLVLGTIANGGARTLAVTGTLLLTRGPGGSRAGPFRLRTSALAPGTSTEARFLLDERLPAGPWRARLRVSSADVTRTASATIRFPDVVRRAQEAHPTPGYLVAFAWIGAAAVLAVATALVRRRRLATHELESR